MRIILYTGKGGVGKTSVAAATALRCAKKGKKTIIVSTDYAHSLGDSMDIKLSSEPIKVEENLWAQEIDPNYEVEKGWGKVQKYLTALFMSKTIKDITTEELTLFPGMQDLLSLLRILDYYKNKTYDVVVIDGAPTGETLALLSFPEMLRWWMDKLFPIKKKAIKIMKPVAEPLLGIPMPSSDVMDEIDNIYEQLDEMKQLFSNRDITSIRIVVNPEKMVIKEAQRSFTYLNIYNFNVDAVVVNRVFPQSVNDDYFKAWKETQSKYRGMIEESFLPIPIYNVPLFEKEVIGSDMLNRMGLEIFKNEDPSAIKYCGRTYEVKKDKEDYIFSINIPFIEKGDIKLNIKGEEVLIRVGNIKRNIMIPKTLVNMDIKGAKFEDERLNIRFGGAKSE